MNIIDFRYGRKSEPVRRGQGDLGLDFERIVFGKKKIKDVGLVVGICKIDIFVFWFKTIDDGHYFIKTGIPGKGVSFGGMDKVSIGKIIKRENINHSQQKDIMGKVFFGKLAKIINP